MTIGAQKHSFVQFGFYCFIKCFEPPVGDIEILFGRVNMVKFQCGNALRILAVFAFASFVLNALDLEFPRSLDCLLIGASLAVTGTSRLVSTGIEISDWQGSRTTRAFSVSRIGFP